MFDLAEALYDRRAVLASDAAHIGRLRKAVAWPGDLSSGQWFQLYASTLSFEPGLVLELGRGYGNSTTAFTAAATKLPTTRVVSVGYDSGEVWSNQTAPRLRRIVGDDFFARLDIHHTDIRDVDFRDLIGDEKRVLLWWDAHGDDLAWFVLGEILPTLAGREAVVCVHDVSDARFDTPAQGYERDDGLPTFWMADLVCPFDEIVPIFDFVSRNRVPVETAQGSLARLRDGDVSRWLELERALKDVAPALHDGGWLYFDGGRPTIFPEYTRSLTEPVVEAQPGVGHIRSRLSSFLRARGG
jgi:hypothetical protein